MKKWPGDIVFVLLVAAAIGGWFYAYPHPKASPLTTLDAPAELDVVPHTYASLSGDKLAYRLYAPAGKPDAVLILLHDTLLHSAWYAELGYQLADQRIAVIAPDRRGWGHSTGKHCTGEGNTEVLVDDLAAMVFVAQAHYSQQPIFIGAHGKSAGLALSYIQAGLPADGVVLLAPLVSQEQPNLDKEGWNKLVAAHPVEAWLAQQGLSRWAVWRYNWPAPMIASDKMLGTHSSIACRQETIPPDLEAAYQAMTAPLLILYGADDPLFTVEETASWAQTMRTQKITIEIVPETDYLTLLNEGASPIAAWMLKKE